jgi:peptide/nickel transport system substrate-binding protein
MEIPIGADSTSEDAISAVHGAKNLVGVYKLSKEENMSTHNRIKTFVRVCMLVVFAASLVGCSNATPTTPPPVTSQSPTEIQPSAVPTQPVAPAPTQAPVEPANIVVVIPEDPPSFNGAVGDTGYDSMVMHLVLLGLTGIDPDGKVYPQLAAELPTLDNGGVVEDSSGSTMTVTWKLRDDVFWADGTPVTADDVIFTYEAIIDPNTGFATDGISYVDGVDKIDDHSFKVRFNSIYPGYLTLFGGRQVVIWPKHYCSAEQGFTAWDCGRTPLSDGPYTLDDWVAGDHMTFARNPAFYQKGKPEIDKITVKIVPDAEVRKTMLLQGDADVIMWATEQIADELKNETKVNVSISPSSRWVMRLFINLAKKGSLDPVADPHPILSDVRVRQAIRMAIDVDTITKQVFRGYSTPVWTEFFRPPYVCDIPRPRYDPEAAKALLEQAGWADTNGDGVRECVKCLHAKKGDLMQLELITYSEYGEPLILTQQLIGEMLGNIGIKVQLTTVQGSVLWADYQSGGIEQRGDFNIDLYDDGYSGLDPTDFIYKYYASASAEPDQGWNIGRYKNPQMDDLLSQAYTLDEETRKDVFCQMAKILDDEVPQILMFTTINADAYSARLSGVEANINDVVTWNAADWKIVR